MGWRKVTVRESAASNIAAVAWFIESKGMIATADKFSDDMYDFIEKLGDPMRRYPVCKETQRNVLGLKYSLFRKKYTVVFIETEEEIIVSEFLSSKLIK